MREANTTLRLPEQPVFAGFSLTNRFGNLRFNNPVALASPPAATNRLFVAERTGKIFVITNLAAPNKTLFLDLSTNLDAEYLEAGLLGLAFHPGYLTNRYFYTFRMVRPRLQEGGDLYHRLARFEAAATNRAMALAETEFVLIDQPAGSLQHNGGDLHFGPDGYLYVSWGDNRPTWELREDKQPLDKDFGMGLLRIDVDKRAGNLVPNARAGVSTNYLVPADNPFVGITQYQGRPVDPTSLRTEYYAIGLRNPWRFSFDRVTGDIYLGDVGDGLLEEINIIEKGGNYGWPYLEENIPTSLSEHKPAQFTSRRPIAAYWHGVGTNQGRAVIGGVVYRGAHIPELYGSYVFADNLIGNVWLLKFDGTTNRQAIKWITYETGISTFGTDPANGDVMVASHQSGLIKRLIYVPPEQQTAFPTRLSETGAFADLGTLAVEPGIVPFVVNTAFWSDGSSKRRWFSLPDLESKFTFEPIGIWGFPNGTVWIKHFELAMTNGVAGSQRRIETRFLVENEMGGYGVTYRWDAQTNASLVPAEGMDEFLPIVDGGTIRTQRWHYPGRGECLSCHNPDFGFALGFKTAQLNRSFAYPGGIDNQLHALSEAGYVSTDIPAAEALPQLVQRTNTSWPIQYHARSYLAANCVQCHQPGTWAAQGSVWDARFNTRLAEARLLEGLIVPGAPGQSRLLDRLKNPHFQMPLIGATMKNEAAIELLTDWISTLPSAPWDSRDVGAVRLEGCSSVHSNRFTVSGAGEGFQTLGDEFHFLSQPLRGNRQIMARVERQYGTSLGGAAGLMVRGGSSTNAPFAMIAIDRSNTVSFLRRESPGAPVTSTPVALAVGSEWLRIIKEDAEVRAFHSADGQTWMPAGAWNSNGDCVAGFAATAQSAIGLNTAEFADVSVSGIAITAPSRGANFTLQTPITVSADVTASSGASRVEFFVGEQKQSEVFGPPYQWVWTNATAGRQTLRAKLIEGSSAALWSEAVEVAVDPAEAQGALLNVDPTTQGDWENAYGQQGFWISDYRSNMTAVVKGGGSRVWADRTSERAALRRRDGSRIAAAAVSTNKLTLDLSFADGELRRVALYFLDWEKAGRAQHVRLLDPAKNRVLESRTISGFESGVYVSFAAQGQVRVEILRMHGPDVVLSGVFVDSHVNQPPTVALAPLAATIRLPTNMVLEAAAGDPDGRIAKVQFLANDRNLGEAVTAPYRVSWSQPLSGEILVTARALDNVGGTASHSIRATLTLPSGAAVFYGTNEVTGGEWKGVFGSDGFNIAGDVEEYPAYADVRATNAALFFWPISSLEQSALQSASGEGRVGAIWFDQTAFELSINLRDGQSHLVSIYCWDAGTVRQQRISVYDAESGALLDQRDLAGFHEGKYLSWILRGHTRMRISKIFSNPNVSGIFFDPDPSNIVKMSAVSLSAESSAVRLRWESVPGRKYQVQHAPRLSELDWQNASGTLMATGKVLETSLEVDRSAAQGFYRLMVLE